MITTRSHQKIGHTLLLCFVQSLLGRSPGMRCLGRHHCSHIGVADGVFCGHATVVLCSLFRRNGGQIGRLNGRNDVQIQFERVTIATVELHGQGVLLAERKLLETEASVLRSPHQHVALAGRERGLPRCIGLLAGHGIELGVVIKLELH